MLTVDPAGRLALPSEARQVCDGVPSVRLWSAGLTVILRRDGTGAETPVDGRGRVLLPSWLRGRRVGELATVFVAARRPDASTVVVTPVVGLDVMADALAREAE